MGKRRPSKSRPSPPDRGKGGRRSFVTSKKAPIVSHVRGVTRRRSQGVDVAIFRTANATRETRKAVERLGARLSESRQANLKDFREAYSQQAYGVTGLTARRIDTQTSVRQLTLLRLNERYQAVRWAGPKQTRPVLYRGPGGKYVSKSTVDRAWRTMMAAAQKRALRDLYGWGPKELKKLAKRKDWKALREALLRYRELEPQSVV